MMVAGVVIGFRIEDWPSFLAGFALSVAFGLLVHLDLGDHRSLFVKDAESAQIAGFIWIFPLTFASSIFVPTQNHARLAAVVRGKPAG